MNQQSVPERLRKALLMTVVTLAGVGFEAHAFEKARGREQDSQQKKTATRQVKSYSCPMHPEVKSTKRGKCPKCKMDLRLDRTDIAGNAVAEAAVTSANSTDAANTATNAPGYARKMVIPDVDVLDQNGSALHF